MKYLKLLPVLRVRVCWKKRKKEKKNKDMKREIEMNKYRVFFFFENFQITTSV
jgi:hypothetical protein